MMRSGSSKNRDPFFQARETGGLARRTVRPPSASHFFNQTIAQSPQTTNVIVDRVIMISLISASPRLSANSC